MENFKNLLAERLSNSIKSIFINMVQVGFCDKNEGFFCDYDIPPLNPSLFSEISKNINTDGLDCVFELDSFSGVYEDGDANKRMLQRIYVTAYQTKEEFIAYKNFTEEALKRDHRTLGNELKLFSHSNDIGQGLTLWHPKGAMIRYLLESFGQSAHIKNGYQWVYTPHIGRAELWETSGHLDFYKDSMYNPILVDGEEYYLKPMNCPFHIAIYNNEVRSYRELPIKYAEYGTVYRYELSGALNGLTRVRGFTQDDAHIICTPEQVEKEVADALKFSLYVLRSFGLEHFESYVATKPEHKFIGTDNDWEMATEILKKAVISAGLEYKIDKGGGAFYGPKIDLKLRDSLNREWQCSTVQFDFNLPKRFNMVYVGSDGKRHTPYMVHRALFGSLERFMALIIEHYKGDFPFWLAPTQVGIVPIKEIHNAYAKELSFKLSDYGIRCSVNTDRDNMRSKIKNFRLEKTPFILIVGDKEAENGTFSVLSRKNGDIGGMDVNAFMEFLKPQVEQGIAKRVLT